MVDVCSCQILTYATNVYLYHKLLQAIFLCFLKLRTQKKQSSNKIDHLLTEC
jgi:hypothetical protein